jgi:hypothetical protein
VLANQNRLAEWVSGKVEQYGPGSGPLAGFDLIIDGGFEVITEGTGHSRPILIKLIVLRRARHTLWSGFCVISEHAECEMKASLSRITPATPRA